MLDVEVVALAVVLFGLWEALVHGFDKLSRGGSR